MLLLNIAFNCLPRSADSHFHSDPCCKLAQIRFTARAKFRINMFEAHCCNNNRDFTLDRRTIRIFFNSRNYVGWGKRENIRDLGYIFKKNIDRILSLMSASNPLIFTIFLKLFDPINNHVKVDSTLTISTSSSSISSIFAIHSTI